VGIGLLVGGGILAAVATCETDGRHLCNTRNGSQLHSNRSRTFQSADVDKNSTIKKTGAALQDQFKVGTLRWDQVQFVKTHNSYQLRMDERPLPDVSAPDGPTLTKQLEGGVRAVELDLQYPTTEDPGDFPVFHETVYDNATTCNSLKICLTEINTWLQANPGEGPVFIHIEAKQKDPIDFTSTHWRMFDSITSNVFGQSNIVRPRTIGLATAGFKWPTIGSTRGNVALILDREYTNYGSDQVSETVANKPYTIRPIPGQLAYTEQNSVHVREQTDTSCPRNGWLSTSATGPSYQQATLHRARRL
jgi:hypothetical protein